jgi:hypothetical protein
MNDVFLTAEINTTASLTTAGMTKDKTIEALARWLKEQADKLPTNTKITLTFTFGEDR